MDNEELDHLAEQLRIAYYEDTSRIADLSWEHCSDVSKDKWRRVAREAYRWLVG